MSLILMLQLRNDLVLDDVFYFNLYFIHYLGRLKGPRCGNVDGSIFLFM